MEFTIAARVLRALSVRHSDPQPKRFMAGTALGASLALLAASPLAMTDAQAAPEVGTLPGSAAVSATGAATYTIPIQLPPGTNGMQPSLALVYNSQIGDGWAGYGWTLSGLSAITRCASNPEDDGAQKGIAYNIPVRYSTTSTYSDDFCLDGQKLMLVSGSYYGANGATYGKQIEDFSVITSYTTGTSKPTYFTVQTKDGRTYEYGNTSDSSILASGTSVVRTWALDKVTDANGNYISYTYGSSSTAGVEYWPQTISYTGNGSTAPDHVIQFDFETKNAMFMGRYTAGSFSMTSQMLQDIKINYGTTTTFTYYLSYVVDGGGGRDTLTSVQQCSGTTTGNCLPATTIAWNPSAAGWQSKVNTGIIVSNQARALAAKLMDVDGDGIDDLVYPDSPTSAGGTGDWMVAFGQPSGGLGTPVDTGIAETSSTYFDNALAMDYNGDGCMDLVIPTASGTWQVLISQCTQTGTIFSTTPDHNNFPSYATNNSQTSAPMFEGNVWAGDFDGDGITDIFNDTGADLELRKNQAPPNDGTFGSSYNWTAISSQRNVAVGSIDVGVDFDGSGRTGALAYIGGTTNGWAAYIATGTGSITQMGGTATQSANAAPAIPFDMNGDGLSDLLTNSSVDQFQITLSTGAGFKNLLYNLYRDVPTSDPLLADYYGNGTQRAFILTNAGWYMLDPTLDSSGTYHVHQVLQSSSPYYYNYTFGTDTLRVGHLSSYGLDDLVYTLNNSGTLYTFYYELHNFTSGEYPDVVNKITDGLGNKTLFNYDTLSDDGVFGVYSKSVSAAYPVHGIQTPLPVVASMSLVDSRARTYTIGYTYQNAEIDTKGHGFLGFASRTISNSKTQDTETITYDQAFPYTGMITRDLLQKNGGAGDIYELDNTGPDQLSLPAGPDGSQRYFPFFDSSARTDYDFGLSGYVRTLRTTTTTLSAASFDGYGNVLNSSTTVTDDTQTGVTFTTQTTATYVSPGSGYCVDLPATVVVTESRTSPVESASRNKSYTDDVTHCRVQSQTVSPGTTSGGTPALTTSYSSFDAFGNVTEVDVTGTGLATRTTDYSFTGGNNEFPTSTTNVVSGTVNLVSNATWDYSLGAQLSATDPNSNPTTMTYDAFGRPVTITRPDGSGTSLAYNSCPGSTYCSAIGVVYTVTSSAFNNVTGTGHASIVTGYTAYDSRGRAAEQGKVLFGGGMSKVDTSYDVLGDVTNLSKPFTGSAPAYSTTYTYDLNMGRITELSQPQDQSDTCAGSAPTPCNDNTSFSYTRFITTATQTIANAAPLSSSSQATARTRDAIGEMASILDANGGTTSYGYDAFGDLTGTTDADGKVTTIGYDGLGHKTGMVDPDMGTWAYQVDALGEVTCQTDAKFQSIALAYDAVGRITGKTETVPKTAADCSPASADIAYTGTWTYDTVSHGAGLPASVSDSNGFNRAYDYDIYSRPLDVTTTPGSGALAYTTSTAYDNFGRVASLTYPSTGISGVARFGVAYNYDSSSGALSSVSDTATNFVYWQVASGGSAPVDAFGHILGYQDGNGVSTVSAYDQATGAVTGIGTGTGSSTTIQQLAYSWDGFGNLKQRCDGNHGLVENFTYDGLNRLSTSKVYSGGTAGSCTQGPTTGAAMALTYDAVGNIQTRSNTGITVGSGTQNDTYTYGDSSHPYGVTGVTSISGTYAYDANGNMVSGNGRTITWNDDNLPVNITASSGSSLFSYGPDLQRYQQTATDSTGTTTTTYVGSLFEEVVTPSGDTQFRHSVMADGGIVAVHTIDQSGSTTNTYNRYMHSDHLGSADVLTDDTGAIAVDPVTSQQQVMSFDAFGMRRNPADWSYNLASISVTGLKAFTDKGYTAQEQLDNVGLIHMNGRVYDPSIGRMISADLTMPDASNSQAFSRYNYVYNNPLEYTDPTGFTGRSMWGEPSELTNPGPTITISDQQMLVIDGALEVGTGVVIAICLPFGGEFGAAALIGGGLAAIDLGSQGLSDLNSAATNTARQDAVENLYGPKGAFTFRLVSAGFDIQSLASERTWSNLGLTMAPYVEDSFAPDNGHPALPSGFATVDPNYVNPYTSQPTEFIGTVQVNGTSMNFGTPGTASAPIPITSLVSSQQILAPGTSMIDTTGQFSGGTQGATWTVISSSTGQATIWVNSQGQLIGMDNLLGGDQIWDQMQSNIGVANWDGVMFGTGGGPKPGWHATPASSLPP